MLKKFIGDEYEILSGKCRRNNERYMDLGAEVRKKIDKLEME